MPPDDHAGSDMDYLLLWITLLVGLGSSVCGHARHLSIYGFFTQILRYSATSSLVTSSLRYYVTGSLDHSVTALLRHYITALLDPSVTLRYIPDLKDKF